MPAASVRNGSSSRKGRWISKKHEKWTERRDKIGEMKERRDRKNKKGGVSKIFRIRNYYFFVCFVHGVREISSAAVFAATLVVLVFIEKKKKKLMMKAKYRCYTSRERCALQSLVISIRGILCKAIIVAKRLKLHNFVRDPRTIPSSNPKPINVSASPLSPFLLFSLISNLTHHDLFPEPVHRT